MQPSHHEAPSARTVYGIPPEGALLILVRHGETTWNAESRVQGQMDSPLSELGIAQARYVAKCLESEAIAAVYSSDLSRAADTARIIAEPHGLGVIPSRKLREADYGDWTGCTMDEVRARWPEEYRRHVHSPHTARIPGGESSVELMERSFAFAREAAERHYRESFLIVGHGGSVRGILCGILGCLERFWGFKLNNGGISAVEWKPTGPRILGINDVSHLRGLGVTGSLQETA